MLRLRRKEPDTCWSSTTSAWTWQDPLTSLQPTPDPAPSSESKVRGHFSPYFLNDGQNVSETEEAPSCLAEARTSSWFLSHTVSHVSVSVQPIRACGYFHPFSLYLKAGCSLIGGAETWNTNQSAGSSFVEGANHVFTLSSVHRAGPFSEGRDGDGWRDRHLWVRAVVRGHRGGVVPGRAEDGGQRPGECDHSSARLSCHSTPEKPLTELFLLFNKMFLSLIKLHHKRGRKRKGTIKKVSVDPVKH